MTYVAKLNPYYLLPKHVAFQSPPPPPPTHTQLSVIITLISSNYKPFSDLINKLIKPLSVIVINEMTFYFLQKSYFQWVLIFMETVNCEN